jgi:hypothetical protein
MCMSFRGCQSKVGIRFVIIAAQYLGFCHNGSGPPICDKRSANFADPDDLCMDPTFQIVRIQYRIRIRYPALHTFCTNFFQQKVFKTFMFNTQKFFPLLRELNVNILYRYMLYNSFLVFIILVSTYKVNYSLVLYSVCQFSYPRIRTQTSGSGFDQKRSGSLFATLLGALLAVVVYIEKAYLLGKWARAV